MMPRRSSKQPGVNLLAGLIGWLLIISVALPLIFSKFFLLFVIGGSVMLIVWKKRSIARRDLANHNLSNKVQFIIDQHLHQLAKRRTLLVKYDPYGKPLTAAWNKEIDSFIADHVSPHLIDLERDVLSGRLPEIQYLIDERAKAKQSEPQFASFSDSMNPNEFEHYCAEQLAHAGWSARVTPKGRDQGVDVEAEKNGLRVVLQCKFYSGAVGNKAVQEIAAGRAFARAHRGAVVTNSKYTSSAEQLAATNGILLLHYSDLAKLDELLH